MAKMTREGLSGGGDRAKGETAEHFNQRRHSAYRNSWVEQKKARGEWEDRKSYEEKTGRKGRD